MNLRVCVLGLGVQSSTSKLCCEVSLKQTLSATKLQSCFKGVMLCDMLLRPDCGCIRGGQTAHMSYTLNSLEGVIGEYYRAYQGGY